MDNVDRWINHRLLGDVVWYIYIQKTTQINEWFLFLNMWCWVEETNLLIISIRLVSIIQLFIGISQDYQCLVLCNILYHRSEYSSVYYLW